jgi:hypothetical protein
MRLFKGFVIILLSLVAFLYISDFFTHESSPTQRLPSYQGKTVMDMEALAAIRREPKVKDAIITEAGVLYASVLDDGTNRTGYASYLCEVLRENHSTVSRVKVVKFASQNDPKKDNAYGVLLGESWCK